VKIGFQNIITTDVEKEYQASPVISYENPNEGLGEDVILIEKGVAGTVKQGLKKI
jgi:hypothetical protein